MSLEAQIQELNDAIKQNTTILLQATGLLREVLSKGRVSDSTVSAGTAAPAAAAAEAAPEKKTTTRKARSAPVVTAPVVEDSPTADGFDDDDGFGDDGFGDDDSVAPVTKNYTGEDARNALKALRDVVSDEKGKEKGLSTAKEALAESGFSNIAHIDDGAAAAVVALAKTYADNLGLIDALLAKAKQYGADL